MFDIEASPYLPSPGPLNPDQRAVVASDARSVVVIAGAGSGKTKTLATRVAYLIEQGAVPSRILLLTFTRRAAREMLSRAEALAGPPSGGKPWGGTFHSVGHRLLRMYAQAVGIPGNFTVMDAPDAADLLDLVRSELGFHAMKRRFPGKDTLASIYSFAVNGEKRLHDVLGKHFPWCLEEEERIGRIFEAYTVRKREQCVLDYDDLLLYWRAILELPDIKAQIAGMFDHILVDEYQDTNFIQGDILRVMRNSADHLMAVGDDAQAIYSFRAATVRNILDFPKHHPDGRVLTLARNYRSTQAILDASNAVIALAADRFVKNLWTERERGDKPRLITCVDEMQQSRAVRERVLLHREAGVLLKNQAVVFRAGHHSAQLEIELAQANIPFVKYGGLKFLESAHVKDAMAFLRVLENPRDELSWWRTLKLVEGIGPAAARRMIEKLGVRGGDVTDSPLQRFLSRDALQGQLESLRVAFADCSRGLGAASEIDRFRLFYEPVCRRLYAAAEARLRDLDQLESIAARYGDRRRLLTELTLDPPVSTGDLAGPPHLDDDYLVLSTMHSAKGCEWDVVHVIHAADGMIPSDMALSDQEGIDEELRLFYVALTRAKNDLYVYFPLRYYHRRFGNDDPHSYGQLTRFLPPKVWPLFDCTSLGTGDEDDGPAPVTAVGSVDSFLHKLWSS
jgi:DNA helicase II / ATP-dependent DNA helicase PcrA